MLDPVLALAMAMAGLVSCMVRVSEPPTSEATPELQRELRGSVEMLCAEPRYGASLGRAQAWIVSELREAGWEVRLQEFENKQGRFANVIAERGGGRSGPLHHRRPL